MTISDLIKSKLDAVLIFRDDFVDCVASPKWKPAPGHAQTWRHVCKLCGHIILDDTKLYEIPESNWKTDVVPHIFMHLWR